MDNIETIREKIKGTLSEKLQQSDLFLVDVQVTPTGKISVFADGHHNITIDKCAEISRFLNKYLEESMVAGDNYSLEVSSPGLDEPFKVSQQYEKVIGREVEVLFKSGVKEIGILRGYDESEITIEIPAQKKKKEIIPAEIKSFNLADIKYTKMHFVFK